MPRLNRQFAFITIASLTPLSYFLLPFFCGFCNLSQGYLMFLVPIALCGSAVTGIAMASLFRHAGMLSRVGVGVLSSIITVALFFLFPAGAKTWTLGFCSNFQISKHPRDVQKWAVNILERYDAGRLSTSTNAPYWAIGKATLDSSEVPPTIETLWRDKPSIGIAEVTSEEWITIPSHESARQKKENRCIVFSWYLSGILVGSPDFRCNWNPWYLREIAPGIYAYCGMK